MLPLWILLAFVAGIASNASNFFSRYILKDGESSFIYAWYFEAVRFIVFVIAAIFSFHLLITTKAVVLLLLMGLEEAVSVVVYMKMHAYSHLSISTIISRTRLVWVPIIGFLILGEHLPLQMYLGIFVLFAGLAVATSPHKLFLDKGLSFAYLSAFLIAINVIQIKINTSFASAQVLIVFLTMPTTLIFPLFIKHPIKKIPQFFKRNMRALIGSGIANVASIFLFTSAIEKGPASVVNGMYQGTMVLSVLAGIFILKETQDIKRKLVGTVIAVIGVILLTLL